ncbi:Sodium/hydrogen exchanger 9B2 [Pseudolycoriella hygida]|uniref:Sodium/hydrogen exchanger 9B2 n=1 Tax=Pseudolycoriella hygida TaxID=35572 RepID=A0A9Q0RYX4_9DIPT|nr:Sodium/hydrogen exchanger 9B2 [Pseudolycoriella hygida]
MAYLKCQFINQKTKSVVENRFILEGLFGYIRASFRKVTETIYFATETSTSKASRMSSIDSGERPISSQSMSETKRKVSIQAEPIEPRTSYDSLGVDLYARRKVSQTSNPDRGELGPARKKSILVQSTVQPTSITPPAPQSDVESTKSLNLDRLNGEAFTRNYINQRLYRQPKPTANIEESWIYALCLRCRVEDNTPSWEPKYWQKLCPYPLCPSYRQFANFVAIVLIGILTWITAFAILGDTAAPGGHLFSLVVLSVAANFGGWLISLTTLPRLVGMLAVGILFQNLNWVDVNESYSEITAEIRKFALTIILVRVGLEIDPEAFKKMYKTILKLGLVPWSVECCVIAVLSYFLFDFPWVWAFALGSIIAAVSPAVVVPCLFRLRTKGYGVVKGIPTCIVAVAGIGDATSVAAFGIISSILFGTGSLTYQISQAPVCILGGLAFGVVWGQLLRIVPEKGDTYLVPIRTLMLLAGGTLVVFGTEKIGYEGAGPLGAVFAALISNYYWCQQGWPIDENPVSTAFEIFWMIFEPILFGITGTVIKFKELDPQVVSVGVGVISAGVLIRILTTIAISFGDKLNIKERIFVSLSWMAKAIVQAALGPVFLRRLHDSHDATEQEKRLAEIMSMICVLSIILTAPIGALLISVSGTKLLTKTKPLEARKVSAWRRRRPSLFDIGIKDEVEEERNRIPEIQVDKQTIVNTSTNQGRPLPIYTLEE